MLVRIILQLVIHHHIGAGIRVTILGLVGPLFFYSLAPSFLINPSQPPSVTVDESVRKDERSNDEEKDENVKGDICQLLDQRTASQRRDKSCMPSH